MRASAGIMSNTECSRGHEAIRVSRECTANEADKFEINCTQILATQGRRTAPRPRKVPMSKGWEILELLEKTIWGVGFSLLASVWMSD